MIKNSANETLDLIVASVNPRPIKTESASKLLNGGWFIQTIGKSAEKLEVKVICSWTVLNEIFAYADTKEKLTIEYLDFTKSGHIIGEAGYDVFSRGSAVDRLYSVTFELAVIPNV